MVCTRTSDDASDLLKLIGNKLNAKKISFGRQDYQSFYYYM